MKELRINALRQWGKPMRFWGLGLLCLAGLALAVALLYVHLNSTLLPQGIASKFSGPETESISPHTFFSLLQTTHTHLFTLLFFQALLGFLFLLSSAPAWLKKWLPGGTFIVVVVDHGFMWLTHYQGPSFSLGVFLSGSLMTLAFLIEWLWCLADLARGK